MGTYNWKQLMAMGIQQDEIRYALDLNATDRIRDIVINEAVMPFIKAKINAYRCIKMAERAAYEQRMAEWGRAQEKYQQEKALQVATDAKNKAELKANPDRYIDRKGLRAKGYTESQILRMAPAFDLPYQYGQGNRKYWYVLEHSN